MSKADIVKNWYHSVWVKGQLDRINTLYAPSPPDQCLLPNNVADPVDIHEMLSILRTLLVEMQIEVVHLIEDGDWVAAILEMNSRSATTNAPVNVRWQVTLHIKGDQIIESYPSFDFLPFFEQLGQLPKDAFELLLTGAVLDVA